MLVIEVTGQGQRPLAQFAIYPMPSAALVPYEQYKYFRYLAQATGHRYFFLVTNDITFGWKIDDEPRQPSFKVNTADLLSRYMESPASVMAAGEMYLAELIKAWLADLATGWKGPGPAPGEAEMARVGLLAELRDGARASYAAL